MRFSVTVAACLAVTLIAPVMASDAVAQESACAVPASPDPSNLYAGATDYGNYLRPTGELQVDVVFVDFSDTPAGNQTTTDLYDELVPRTIEWIETVSEGAATLDVRSDKAWHRVPKESPDYGIERGALTFEKLRAYIADAIAAADDSVDFSETDLIWVVPPRGSGIEYTPAYTAFEGSGIPVDGNEIRYGTTLGEEQLANPTENIAAHTIVHETGHAFGLPDLYDYGSDLDWYGSQGHVGAWDPMGWLGPGASFMTWHRLKLGWFTGDDIACVDGREPTELELGTLNGGTGPRALVLPTGKTTFLVAEVRERSGIDSQLCDEGVLIYKVDTGTPSGAGAVTVMSDNNGTNSASLNFCGPKYDAPFDVGSNEDAEFEDPGTGISITVLEETAAGYRLDVGFSPLVVEMTPGVSLRLRKHLVARGSVTDDVDGSCSALVEVTISKRKGGGWRSLKSVTADYEGSFKIKLPDKTGKYRASVDAWDSAAGTCLGASSSAAKHRHG